MTTLAPSSEPKRMQCMEVWGGNHAVDTGVIMAGLDAWLYSRPHGNDTGGGDIHYVSSCAAGMITRLLIADVAGHGSAVSEVAAHLRRLMRRYINYHDQTKFIEEIDREFADLKASPGSFATAVAITFESVGNRFLMCNAGHPPPLRRVARTGRWEAMERGVASAGDALQNIPLGIELSGTYVQVETHLHTGDMVLCYTDSLSEACRADGEPLGVEGLIQILNGIDASAPSQIIPELLHRIEGLHPRNLHDDDVTVLLFRPNGLMPRVPLSSRLLIPYHLARAGIASLLGRN